MALDTKTREGIAALARLPLGGEAMYRGELVRKVRLLPHAVHEFEGGRCEYCPLYSFTENEALADGEGEGDRCDRYQEEACTCVPCIPPGYEDDFGRTIVPVSIIPRLVLKGYMS